MLKQTLHDGWTVRAIGDLAQVPGGIRNVVVPASVPGCVHTALLRAGLIEDPYYGLNEPKQRWIGETDWEYCTNFTADPKLFEHERIDLVCDGLDTVATILLNGSEIARTQNMHRGYRFDVRPALRKGTNELIIRFASPVKYAIAMREKLGHLPSINYGIPFNFIRKMACNFGWDWGPVVPTCGIWRGVRLEGWSKARLKTVRTTLLSSSDHEWVVRVALKLDGKADHCSVQFNPPSGKYIQVEDFASEVTDFTIRNPALWWPAGYGQQPLYRLAIQVNEDFRTDLMGLRTVVLDTHPDDIGRGFTLKVNGKPIFCKGFNWIPDDCFLDRACTPDRYRRRIQQALDANANMLRVWGGGIYETDEFYDICDELGILVWQDFLFACAAYPEAEPFKSEVEAEARENVARLAHHPSLVLWNGCNENLWGYHAWATADANDKPVAWKEQLAGKQWGQGYYLDLLPRVMKEVDPSRPYWAASPWSGDADVENGLHPNLATHGNKHIWEVWHGPGDYNNYRWFSPRFCSEFGYQGPANYSTMLKYMKANDEGGGMKDAGKAPTNAPSSSFILQPSSFSSAVLEMHQKSPGGNERNDRLLAKDFEIPDNFDDWHYLLQLNQARALAAGVEWFRSRQPVCMGTLYWQLNDCYPVTSWSAIDCDGRLKPLWYATRRFYAPQLLTIQPEQDGLILFANNDTDEAWKATALVRRISFDGKARRAIQLTVDIPPRTNGRIGVLPIGIVTPADKTTEMICASVGDQRALWYFAPDKELNYPPPRPQASLDRHDETHWRLTVRTPTLLRDVVVNIDRVDPDASISDNVVTILPGEQFSFDIESRRGLTLEQLISPPVFQCANRFGRRE
jgi:beta-mannosidase